MTKEQFNKKVGFETLKTENGDTELIGGIKLESRTVISKEFADNDALFEDVKFRIMEELWRLVYEDRRKLFMEKIMEARRCAFWDFKAFDEKMREISTLVLEGL